MVTMPTYVILLAAQLSSDMSAWDVIFVRVLMSLVVLEFFTDQQQWSELSYRQI